MTHASGMVDTHTHILHGVDDGCVDLDAALEMAKQAQAKGVTGICATPHLLWKDREPLDTEQIEELLDELREFLALNRCPVQVYSGCEIPLDLDLIPEVVSGRWASYGGHGKAVLVEPPFERFPEDGMAKLRQLMSEGIQPVLAHPERCAWFQEDHRRFDQAVNTGALLQVTVSSLRGDRATKPVYDAAMFLLQEGLCGLVASDAHNTRSRGIEMDRGAELLSQLVNERVSVLLTRTVPNWLVTGQQVNHSEIYDSYRSAGEYADNGGWLQRLFGRFRKRRSADDDW